MATTALDIISRALRMIGATSPGQPIAAEDADAALTALNAILYRFPGLGHAADYVTSTPVAFASKHDGNVAWMLAYEIAPEFGREMPGVVAREYPGARARFSAEYQYLDMDTDLEMAVDGGLLKMPSQFEDANYRSET